MEPGSKTESEGKLEMRHLAAQREADRTEDKVKWKMEARECMSERNNCVRV